MATTQPPITRSCIGCPLYIRSRNYCLKLKTYISNPKNPPCITQDKAARPLEKKQQEKLNKALLEAVKKGDLSKVQELVQEGADVNFKTRSGDTALHIAASEGHLEIFDFLLKNGADPTIINKKKKTPIDVACDARKTNILEYIRTQLEEKIDISNLCIKSFSDGLDSMKNGFLFRLGIHMTSMLSALVLFFVSLQFTSTNPFIVYSAMMKTSLIIESSYRFLFLLFFYYIYSIITAIEKLSLWNPEFNTMAKVIISSGLFLAIFNGFFIFLLSIRANEVPFVLLVTFIYFLAYIAFYVAFTLVLLRLSSLTGVLKLKQLSVLFLATSLIGIFSFTGTSGLWFAFTLNLMLSSQPLIGFIQFSQHLRVFLNIITIFPLVDIIVTFYLSRLVAKIKKSYSEQFIQSKEVSRLLKNKLQNNESSRIEQQRQQQSTANYYHETFKPNRIIPMTSEEISNKIGTKNSDQSKLRELLTELKKYQEYLAKLDGLYEKRMVREEVYTRLREQYVKKIQELQEKISELSS